MKFARRLPQIAAFFAAVSALGCSLDNGYQADVAQNIAAEERLDVLTAEEVRRVLTGNTIVGTRDGRRYWVYHPTGAAMWGLESSGDVDAGSWHLNGDLYCRAWRRWHEGREKCWRLAINSLNQLVWVDPGGWVVGASQLQAGNTIGLAATPQQVQAYLDPEISPALELDIRDLAQSPQQSRPFADEDPVDAFGIPLVLLPGATAGRGEAGAGDPSSLNAADLAGSSIVGGSKSVDSSTISGADAQVGDGTASDLDADAGVDVDADAGGASADLDADAGVDVDADAGGASADVGADVGADAGGTSVDADGGADVDADTGDASADVGANAEADVDADAGGASADLDADAGADVDADTGGASADVGANLNGSEAP